MKKYIVIGNPINHSLSPKLHNYWIKQSNIDAVYDKKLISENELSSFIIIGIHNSGKKRWSDYFPEKAYNFVTDSNYLGGVKPELNADQYLKYIVKEVIPFIEEKYPKSSYDYKTIIGGSSMGGLISMYAVFEYANVFDGAICMSTHWPGAIVMENNPLPEAIFKYMTENIPFSNKKRFSKYKFKSLI